MFKPDKVKEESRWGAIKKLKDGFGKKKKKPRVRSAREEFDWRLEREDYLSGEWK